MKDEHIYASGNSSDYRCKTTTTTTTSEAAPQSSHCPRPGLAPRQASFSKRHASFDTPREIPFPAHLVPHREAFDPVLTRRSSGSTVTPAASRSASPKILLHAKDQTDSLSSQLDHGVLSTDRLGRFDSEGGKEGFVTNSRRESGSTGLEASETDQRSRESLQLDTQRSDGVEGDVWNSSLLRPLLLTSARPKPPISHESREEFAPYFYKNQDNSDIHAPKAERASSSTLSLPLPKQLILSTLPDNLNAVDPATDLPILMEKVHSRLKSGPSTQTTEQLSVSPPSRRLLALSRKTSSPSIRSLSSSLFERDNRRSNWASEYASDSSSSRNSTSGSSMPPPTPPQVHSPPPSTSGDIASKKDDINNVHSTHAPYEPFLSHAPPPHDSSISVETLDSEYRLIVRLPGYQRDCIDDSMLSTRRRRTLHIAADSWAEGSGHFERRISFGYDADLIHVRAEFDGEHLRVIIPRKVSPIIWREARPSSQVDAYPDAVL